MRDDHTTALRAFRLIAAYGSFTRAAAEVGVTPSALSQSLRQLERRLEARLLQRTTRRVGLTEAGRSLLTRVTPALNEIEMALEEIRQHGKNPAGTLRLTVPHAVVAPLLEPIVAEFLLEYPQIRLDVSVDNRLADLVGEGYDAGIRLGEKLQRDVVAVKLGGPLRSVVVGSPQYLARRGVPKHPRELQAHGCIRSRYGAGGAVYRWEFAQKGRWFTVPVDGNLIVSVNSLGVRAAVDGVGLFHTLDAYVLEHVRAGRLQTLLDSWLPPYDGFYLYYPTRVQVPPKLRVFIDFLRTHQRQLPLP